MSFGVIQINHISAIIVFTEEANRATNDTMLIKLLKSVNSCADPRQPSFSRPFQFFFKMSSNFLN